MKSFQIHKVQLVPHLPWILQLNDAKIKLFFRVEHAVYIFYKDSIQDNRAPLRLLFSSATTPTAVFFMPQCSFVFVFPKDITTNTTRNASVSLGPILTSLIHCVQRPCRAASLHAKFSFPNYLVHSSAFQNRPW